MTSDTGRGSEGSVAVHTTTVLPADTNAYGNLFGGQLAPLVAHYARYRAVSPEELARLKSLIAELETDDE